jgi:hypothetical protein
MKNANKALEREWAKPCRFRKALFDQRIPKNYILRKISNIVDFDFVYKEVKSISKNLLHVPAG